MSEKILITGASGFVGNYLCQFFANLKFDVIACATSAHDRHHDKIHYYYFRLPHEKFTALIEKEKPNYLIHCAGSASVSKSFDDPQKDYQDNVTLTEFVLKNLLTYSPKTRVLFLSSAAVYGEVATLPITENTPLNPISPYGFHKLIGETLCKKYHSLFNLPITIARIFSIYGPGLKKQIFWDLYQKSFSSEVIHLQGNGKETRDFIFISDLGEIIYRLMQISSFNGNIINLATGNEISIELLAKMFLTQLNTTQKLIFDGRSRTGDPKIWKAKLNDHFKDFPFLSLSKGIELYIKWLKTINPAIKSLHKSALNMESGT